MSSTRLVASAAGRMAMRKTYVATALVAMLSVLLLACSIFVQYRTQHVSASAPQSMGGSPVELLTFEMLHDPECTAEEHCRSACRMVCDEVHSGQGAREHAATLISFGCCMAAPVITKQPGIPVQLDQVVSHGSGSPLQLLSQGQPAHEDMLFQVNARGHVRFDRPADTRKDSIAVHILRDRHSLASNLKDLERDQAALARRVSKLKLKDILPFKVAKGQTLLGRTGRGSKHPGKLFPEGPGSADPYYEPEDRLADSWEEHDCDLPLALRGKVNCTIGSARVASDSDPYGVERQAEMKSKHEARWRGKECMGPGCPEADSSWQEYDRYRAFVQAADQYGNAGTFLNSTGEKEGFVDPRSSDVRPIGTAWKDEEEHYDWCGEYPEGGYQLNAYQCYKNCSALAGMNATAKDDCFNNLKFAHQSFQWIRTPGCVPNVTLNTSADGAAEEEAEYTADMAAVDAAASCMKLVPVRTLYDYGYAVASGNYSAADMEAAFADDAPPEDAIKAYLGDDLFREFQDEEEQHLPFGNAHMRLQVGQHRIGQIANFKKAYGGKTEEEWCLEQHRHDKDFPRACLGDGKEFAARPWQARAKPRTAPEAAMEGIAYAFRNLIGDDHRERVVDKTGAEAAGQVHRNKFEYGAVTVQPGHVAAQPAPWLRNKGLRYMPQSYEGKSASAHDQAKLPGINIDSWGGGVAMSHHTLAEPIAYTPSSCCSHFVDYSEYA